jgi:hypothetical protein
MHYSPPRVKFGYTPSKETANRVARDTHSTESPGLDPPSVLKNWATRGYDLLEPSPIAPSAEGARRGFEEEQIFADEEEEDLFEMSKVSRSLPNFGEGAGTTAKIEDLLGDESFARLVDDDEDRLPEEEDEEILLEDQEYYGEEDQQLYNEEEGEDTNRAGRQRDLKVALDGPEDTLFGMRPNQPRPDDSFDDEGAGGFQLKGRINLADTQALDHHMQTDSPLAGRGAGL